MHRPCNRQLPTAVDLARAQVVRAASGARTGSLKLRSGDLELDSGLGPELSGRAPAAYDRTIRLHDPKTMKAHVKGDSRVAAASDLRGADRDGLAYATTELQSVRIEVSPKLTITAAAISTRLRLSKEGGRVRNSITVELRRAVLEVEGLAAIVLPAEPAANTLVSPELVQPLGMRLVANAQVQRTAGPFDRAVAVAAIRLSFDRAAPIGIHHAGEVVVAIADASLALESGPPAPAMVGWMPGPQNPSRVPRAQQPQVSGNPLPPSLARSGFLRSTA